jgi:transaldolase
MEAVTVADVRRACDLFLPTYEATGRRDGLVSIEVAPSLAHDAEGTVAEAARLWSAVDRPNVMIKIPGTREGLTAIESALADGINVNVTLLFSVDRYEQVIDAFLSGLERRASRGEPIDSIASVASFFVSRVDTNVDGRLDELDDDGDLRGRIAIANAASAYELFQRAFDSPRWDALADQGAQRQRPLWASTSTKDPSYPDTYYVDALVAPDTVNTLPPATLEAYRDHGDPAIRIHDRIAAAAGQLERLESLGVDLDDVTAELETEGVAKFAASYDELLSGIRGKTEALAAKA